MSDRTNKHEIKLQSSVIVILGVIAVGLFAMAFGPAFSVKNADAALNHCCHSSVTRDDTIVFGDSDGFHLSEGRQTILQL